MASYTTVVICADGKKYYLAKGEFPPQPPIVGNTRLIKKKKHKAVNAYMEQVT